VAALIVMLPSKAIVVLVALGVFGLGLMSLYWDSGRPRQVHPFSLNTPCGEVGLAEYDWNRTQRDFGSSGLTVDGYRERICERFLFQKLQPKARYATVVFLGSHSCRIDHPISSVFAVCFGATCISALLVLAGLKMSQTPSITRGLSR